MSLNLQHSLATGCRGQRLWGCFHHLKSEQERIFKGAIYSAMEAWGRDVEAGGSSVGTILELGGGNDSGLFIREVPMRPFTGI